MQAFICYIYLAAELNLRVKCTNGDYPQIVFIRGQPQICRMKAVWYAQGQLLLTVD